MQSARALPKPRVYTALQAPAYRTGPLHERVTVHECSVTKRVDSDIVEQGGQQHTRSVEALLAAIMAGAPPATSIR